MASSTWRTGTPYESRRRIGARGGRRRQRRPAGQRCARAAQSQLAQETEVSGSERRKGAGGELEVARIFKAAGFDCDRTPNSGGLRIRGDLHGELPLHV